MKRPMKRPKFRGKNWQSNGTSSLLGLPKMIKVLVRMFDWFKSERRVRRKKVRQDRKQLEVRARRFLKSYLEADEVRKPEFYRAVEDISKKCRPPDLEFSQPDLDDGQIAEATSKAAMQMVLERENRRVGDFVTDACATVAVAYHRAAGVYKADADMQELGTAAVHLLTMATSYTNAQKNDLR